MDWITGGPPSPACYITVAQSDIPGTIPKAGSKDNSPPLLLLTQQLVSRDLQLLSIYISEIQQPQDIAFSEVQEFRAWTKIREVKLWLFPVEYTTLCFGS